MNAVIPIGDAKPSDFGAFLDAARPAPHRRPDPATVAAVPLWGIDWVVSMRRDGTVSEVKLYGRWLDAREALRDSICNAIELAYAEMPA